MPTPGSVEIVGLRRLDQPVALLEFPGPAKIQGTSVQQLAYRTPKRVTY